MAPGGLRLLHRTRRRRITKEHQDEQEAEPERLSLSDHLVRLRRQSGTLHVRQRLRMQRYVHLRQGLRLLDCEVAPELGTA